MQTAVDTICSSCYQDKKKVEVIKKYGVHEQSLYQLYKLAKVLYLTESVSFCPAVKFVTGFYNFVL